MSSFDSNLDQHIINMNENAKLINKPDASCGKYLYYFIVFIFIFIIAIFIVLLVVFK
jgi:hypothetical protein